LRIHQSSHCFFVLNFQSVLLGNNRSLQSTGLGDILLRLLNLNDTEDEGSSPEMKVLNKIMRDLKVGGLPERTLSYEQVNYFRWKIDQQKLSNKRSHSS
jgi:hypothetical protein